MKHLLAWLPALVLFACTVGPPPVASVTTLDTIAACRRQANTTYAMQNRDQIYSMSDLSAPLSSIGLTQDPNRALADRYTQERMVQDCIRNTGTETNRAGLSPGAGSFTPAGPIPPPPSR